MGSGVTIQLPETVLIDPDVTVGEDTEIEPFVQLLGKTKIGANCAIRAGSIITDSVLGDAVIIKPYSIVNASRLDADTQAGPFAHLRHEAHLHKGARVGNFVEVKKSTLGEGVKSMHLTYLGDAKIGRKTNVGAGTITCNYDGEHKNPTTIGDRVFIGSNSALVAPVKVGDGAYVAAGSTITENVPPGALGIARGKQVNKPGWVAARKREAAASAKPHRKPKSRKRLRPKPRRKPTPRKRKRSRR
jgi:bifunctional UDP-N-acetylglucosamine pyrophosphorylase/glucosamine-1-phosphate N-acetyltransferase